MERVTTMLEAKRSPMLDHPHPPARRVSMGLTRPQDRRTELTPMVLIATPVEDLRRLWSAGIKGFNTVEAADRLLLVRIMERRTPAVVLLDLDLPQLGGMDGVAALRRSQPAAKIVILTSRPDAKEGIAALKMGARGYCDRGISPLLLGKAVQAVQNGELWIGRRLISHLLEELSALTDAQTSGGGGVDIDDRLSRLTPRQRDIVELLGAGASNKEIAQTLAVAERTVKAHLTDVFRKLGTSGRLQAALLVVEHSRTAHLAGRSAPKVRLTG